MTERKRILEKTSGGLDVFTHYLGDGCKNSLFRNPYRTDANPSCKLYYIKNSGKYIMKDYGDSQWHGDCFWLVAKISQLNLSTDFSEVLHIIDKDLNLFIFDDSFTGSYQALEKQQPVDLPRNGGMLTAKVLYQKMTRADLSYWSRYGITEDILSRYHVKSVCNARFTRNDGTSFTIFSSIQQKVFAYLFNEGKGQKYYRPGADRCRFLYAGNLPNPYVFGWDQLPEKGNVVYITGGEKDVMTLSARGFSAISLNSETAMLRESLFKQLLERFQYIVFLYDCDETGIRESTLRVQELSSRPEGNGRVFRVQLPLSGSKTEKDISDYFRMKSDVGEIVRLTHDCILNKYNIA